MKFLIIIIFYVGLCSCSSDQSHSSFSETGKKDNYLNLPDSLFALKNIPDTKIIESFRWDHGLFLDSTKKIKFHSLDSSQKQNLLVHMIYDSSSIMDLMFFDFISKQNKIGTIQPIVIHGGGDDYDELFLLTLDAHGKPIAYYSLYGGLCAGSWDAEDSLNTWCPTIHSFFRSDSVITSVVKEYDRKDASTNSCRIDSLTYSAKISFTGEITSKLIDSVRFYKPLEK
ncbi:MAG TPA: hypothetical protein VE978_19325 [Chitinophagales bacterium]|nr:hypothetical protein [Chitinophagales bacterium]